VRITLLALAVVLSLGVATATLQADPDDEVMSFQGRLADRNGFPLNGTYRLTVRIYGVEKGGKPAFTEAFSAVTVTNGIFHVLLGRTADLTLRASTKYWVSLEVDSDGEMSPRIRLARGHLVGPPGAKGESGTAGEKGDPGTVAFGGTVTGSNSTQSAKFSNTGTGSGVRGEGTSGIGVYGTSAGSYGLYGHSVSSNGVRGSSDNGDGIYGSSVSHYGVRGLSTTSAGVHGQSTSGMGIFGLSTTNAGVHGISSSYYGVLGKSTSSIGVWGESSNSIGVVGITSRTGVDYAGVQGQATGAVGVRGISITSYGLYGTSSSSYGVYGKTLKNSASLAGVYGMAESAVGVHGVSTTRHGVQGASTSNHGVHGSSTSSHGVYGTTSRSGTSYAGVYGSAASAVGVRGISTIRYGVWGSSTGQIGVYGASTSNTGVWGETSTASKYAGYFRNLSSSSGNGVFVSGTLLVTSTKSFVQPHPTDRKKAIVYVCLEGGEAGTYCRGSGQLLNGRARIDLPGHFRLVTAEQGLTAVVTPTSMCAGLMVVTKTSSYIVVQELGNGKSAATFDWKVNGLRAGYENHEPITSDPAVMQALGMGDRDLPAGEGTRR